LRLPSKERAFTAEGAEDAEARRREQERENRRLSEDYPINPDLPFVGRGWDAGAS
jgi:hypothetical protein